MTGSRGARAAASCARATATGASAAATAADAAAPDLPRAKRSPWVIGIIIGFAVMLLMNAVFITIAVKGADSVVPSYETGER